MNAMHASAPPNCKCATCMVDGKPCPACYQAYWHVKHPPETNKFDIEWIRKVRNCVPLACDEAPAKDIQKALDLCLDELSRRKFDEWCETVMVVKGMGRRVIHYYAELLYVNGGTTAIKEVNRIKHDPSSPYQRQGLTGPEALQLSIFAGISKGFCLCDVIKDEDVISALKKELDRDLGLTIEVYTDIPKGLIIQ